MTVSGSSLFIYDCKDLLRNSFVGAYAPRWRVLSRSCPGVVLNIPDTDMPFVCHATGVEYACRVREMLLMDILSESNVVDLFRFYLPASVQSILSDTVGR